jgi:small-conductance mechanosensitive channel
MEQLIQYLYRFESPIPEIVVMLGSIIAGLVIKYILFEVPNLYKALESPLLIRSFRTHLQRPATFFIPLLVIVFTFPMLSIPAKAVVTGRRIIEICLVIGSTWIFIKLLSVFQDIIRSKYQINKADNIRERRILTQLSFLRKVATIIIVVLASSAILMSFESARKLGTGLLTSAGIAGIIIGFAAQKSIANLLAGFQIAFTQPIRIDDVLVVEEEYGNVEEITLTYVVVRLWDLRRLILPINYFLEKPFENWTRTSAELLGTVYLYTDYTVPVDDIRQELQRILASRSDLWDGKVGSLQVTDAREQTVQIRALMSARNSSNMFDLRCFVREKLVEFVQKNYPDNLPKIRAELSNLAENK